MSAALAISPAQPAQVWLTKDELLQRTGVNARTIERYVKAERVLSVQLDELGLNGKPTRKYLVESLPAHLQAKLSAKGRRSVPKLAAPPAPPSPLQLVPAALTPAPVGPLFAGIPAAPPARAVLIDPRDVEVASFRERMIRPMLEFKAEPLRFRSLQLADGRAVTTLDLLALYLCETCRDKDGSTFTRSTLWNWKAAYEKDGLPGLAPKRRSDKGRSRWAAEHRELADLAAHIYMPGETEPGQSVRVAWEQVCRMAAAREESAPSYETVRAFLENPNEVSQSMKTLARHGRKAYEARFAPFLKRGYTEPANQIWVSDHMICDVLVQDDSFDRDMRHCRIQMTTILDYRSRMVLGVAWCRNGSSHSIKRALLQAITRHGLPEGFYCDNGKDYRKIAEGASAEELRSCEDAVAEMRVVDGSVMKRLGVKVTFCEPFHPQSKHVERYHRFFHERFDRAFPTYTAGAPHLRPDATVDAMARHGKLLKMGDTRSSSLPLASEYIAMAEAWIERFYHQRPHEGQGMDQRSPAECFAAERMPLRPAPELPHLAALFADTERRLVRNCMVELDGAKFVPAYTDQLAAYQMHELNGRKVIVAFDRLRMDVAVVLDLEGFPLCQLERQQLTRFAHDDETSAQIAGMHQQRGMLAKAAGDSLKALGTRVKQRGYKTQAEQLRELARLPATGTDGAASTTTNDMTGSIVQRPQKTGSRDVVGAPTYLADAVEGFFGR